MLEVDSVLWEQCVHCHDWQPMQEMQWDEESKGYSCGTCFAFSRLW